MWPFKRRSTRRSVRADVSREGDVVVIDVRGQTCPGYLLAIDRAVQALPGGTRVKLRISYPPCGADVRAWCRERGLRFLDIVPAEGEWLIQIHKP